MQIPQWTVAFPQRDRNFSISALTQCTAENADCCGKCESAFRREIILISGYLAHHGTRSRPQLLYSVQLIFFINWPRLQYNKPISSSSMKWSVLCWLKKITMIHELKYWIILRFNYRYNYWCLFSNLLFHSEAEISKFKCAPEIVFGLNLGRPCFVPRP